MLSTVDQADTCWLLSARNKLIHSFIDVAAAAVDDDDDNANLLSVSKIEFGVRAASRGMGERKTGNNKF